MMVPTEDNPETNDAFPLSPYGLVKKFFLLRLMVLLLTN